MTYVRPPPATHKSGLVSRAPARKRGEMTHCAAGADRGGSERRRTAGPRRSSTRCSLARSIQSQTICLRRSRHCRTVGFARPSVPPTGSLAWKFFARARPARGSRRTCLRGAPVLVSAVTHSSSRAAHLSTAYARAALLSGREEGPSMRPLSSIWASGSTSRGYRPLLPCRCEFSLPARHRERRPGSVAHPYSVVVLRPPARCSETGGICAHARQLKRGR